jgi:hypothetical protein
MLVIESTNSESEYRKNDFVLRKMLSKSGLIMITRVFSKLNSLRYLLIMFLVCYFLCYRSLQLNIAKANEEYRWIPSFQFLSYSFTHPQILLRHSPPRTSQHNGGNMIYVQIPMKYNYDYNWSSGLTDWGRKKLLFYLKVAVMFTFQLKESPVTRSERKSDLSSTL